MKILVTLDGSNFSESILSTIAKLAGPLGAEIELLTIGAAASARETQRLDVAREVVPAAAPNGTRLRVPLMADTLPAALESRGQAVERVEHELRDYLARCARDLHGLTGITPSTHVEIAAHPGQVIIDRARHEHVDLIAMATHGRTGLSHLLTGSVCEEVVRSGVAPVLVLRP